MEYSRSRLLTLTFIIEGIAFVSALLLSKYFNITLFPVTEKPFRDMILGTFGASLPLVLFAFSLSKKAEKIPLLGSLRKTMIFEIRGIFTHARLIDLIIISMLAGFAEEMLFRGVLQVKFGIFFASILFGLMHAVTPAYLVITIIMGFYLGMLFNVFESLLVPIQLHVLYDLAALIHLKYLVRIEHTH
jgi:membrane protease YdiL (CAAX protease family)